MNLCLFLNELGTYIMVYYLVLQKYVGIFSENCYDKIKNIKNVW